ncbi:MAG: RpiB/LacA/LacB family sugar-phosphate isomerase, partial [Alphaproteobacteria bacterium]|nr:RpiB/LacA/LacB family sugar-phosphate isomerase [Alphaproteobacteria bacterium]
AALMAFLTEKGIDVTDVGPHDKTSVDYPDYGAALAAAMKEDDAASGIAICGSGIGISIAVNRYPWMRAALVSDMTAARLCREHNNANVLALGERLVGIQTALDCVEIFLATPFAGGRHERRVAKLMQPDGLLS